MGRRSSRAGRRLPRPGRRATALGAIPALVIAGFVGVNFASAGATEGVITQVSSFTASNGTVFTATNHLVQDSPATAAAKRELVASARNGTNPQAQKIVTAEGKIRHEYLVVWAGDENAIDTNTAKLAETRPAVDAQEFERDARTDSFGPDFLAVVDATKGSPTYGKVVNTVTLGPVYENEPHHMQYIWHKGDAIYAGALYTDITYVFDISALPRVELSGVNLPTDTPCGSIPDAFWTLEDGTAYGTYMGGANVPGPCTYTNGEVRVSNGYGGSPGSLVHIGPDGRTLSEVPVSLPTSEGSSCVNYPPLPEPTCANPHGVQVREDLDLLISSDYVEPRNIVLDPVGSPDPLLLRDTVRVFDISDRDDARLISLSHMPDGPRDEDVATFEEPRGTMEVGVTNRPGHKGAFTSAMCGGAVYYTPDISVRNPVWRQVWDVTAYSAFHYPERARGEGCAGSSWIQVSLDDKYLYNAVIGRGAGSISTTGADVAKQVYMLDIRKLLAAGTETTCSIDNLTEARFGGSEQECPTLADSYLAEDNTSGGPHWGAEDNFRIGKDGYYHETIHVKRIAFTNYFVSRTNVEGNHNVCILNISKAGELTLDTSFVNEDDGMPCTDFNRKSWPHGDYGNAKPHSMVFAVADEDVR